MTTPPTKLTLTFDNGPDPEVTPAVLTTLRQRGILATFFVLGSKLREQRALAERAHAEGHWVGNHTYHHDVPLGHLTEPGVATAEIARTEALIGDLAHPRRFFRPFGGGGMLDQRLLNAEAVDQLTAGGYTCVLWNVIPRDWVAPDTWVETALDLALALPEALIVLHDLPTGAMRRLDRFIGAALDRGATFGQDFPTSCVPIECGRVVTPLAPYVTVAPPRG